MRRGLCVVLALVLLASAACAAEMGAVDGVDFKVKKERPRIWILKEEWRGPNVPQLKKWFQLPEYRKRGVGGHHELQYVVNGDEAAGSKAVAQLCKMKIGGSSPSYSGAPAQRMAARYDWLRNHPDFTAAKRADVVKHLEKWGDYFTRFATGRGSCVYYSRYPGAIGGLCCIGLALYGDSPKADKYIAAGYRVLVEYGKCRAYEGGASAGGTYSIHHAFPDLARAVTAFESATDAGLLEHIEKKQDDWLRKQLYWQIWSTYPNGYFVKEGDLWQNPDRTQTRMQIDVVTNLLDDPYGRRHAELMHERWGRRDYHGHYVWNFFIFNDPGVKPKPLSELGKAAIFGRDSHGYVIFRSGWDKDDTHIFFRCGEGLDVHSNKGAGAFDIWRHQALAQRANRDYPKGDDRIQYSNALVFNDHDHPSSRMKTNFPIDFEAFLKRKKQRNVEVASIVDYEVTDEYARVKGDISAAVKRDCEKWTRELVFLGYKYLLVLDRVVTKKPVSQKWQIHLAGDVKVDGVLATATRGKGRLFCKTVLPAEDDVTVSAEEVRKFHRHAVSLKEPAAGASTWLHVLYPTESDVDAMPAGSVKRANGKLTVTVGELSYTFGK
ncbi:MAG: hypothetical protein R6V58_15930 [Planctomycetota bacterium]